jgi:hypothetical protein
MGIGEIPELVGEVLRPGNNKKEAKDSDDDSDSDADADDADSDADDSDTDVAGMMFLQVSMKKSKSEVVVEGVSKIPIEIYNFFFKDAKKTTLVKNNNSMR